MIKFNLNDYIRVKLSDKGRQILHDRHDVLNEMIQRKGGRGLPTLIIKIDEDGYTAFQWWELMSIFGSFMGMARENPFDLNILIDVRCDGQS